MKCKEFCQEHRPFLISVMVHLVGWACVIALVFLFRPQEAMASNLNVTAETQPEVTIQQTEPIPTTIEPTEPAVVVPEEAPEPVVPPRYGFTEDDIYLMATLLTGSKYVDGDGEFDFDYGRQDEYDQISLVLSVVMNRVRSDLFPSTVHDVIWQKGQFSPMTRWTKSLPEVSDISLQRVTEWCDAYDTYLPGAQSIPEDHLYFRGDGIRNHSR